jgi:hypothetical protein
MAKKFSDLVVAGPDGHFHINDPETGKFTLQGSAQEEGVVKEIENLMRETGLSMSLEDHRAMGASVREPIRKLASYRMWTDFFLVPMPVGLTEDNAIPVDEPIGVAFYSSPEGRAMYITPGVQQWIRPLFYEIKGGVEIYWKTLRTAGWPILRRRLEETADDMARKRDTKTKTVMDAALAALAGHVVTVSGGLFTKSSIDNLIKAAVPTGFPITRGSINPGRIMDMTDWTNGNASAFAFFKAPDEASRTMYRQLYHEGYGNVTWKISHSHPMGSIYLSGEPENIGYHQTHGATESRSEVVIDPGLDKHIMIEEHADYVDNAYSLWRIDITA